MGKGMVEKSINEQNKIKLNVKNKKFRFIFVCIIIIFKIYVYDKMCACVRVLMCKNYKLIIFLTALQIYIHMISYKFLKNTKKNGVSHSSSVQTSK